MEIAHGVVDGFAQGLSHPGWLDEGADQHVVGKLGRGPGIGEGEVEAKLAEAFLIVRVHHLQVGQGVGDAALPVAGAGRLQGIEGHPGAAIADAVHVDAKSGPIQRRDVTRQIRLLVVDDAVAARILAVRCDAHLAAVGIQGQMGMQVIPQHAGIGQEGGAGEGIPLQHAVEEDLDRIGLDEGVAGEGVAHLVRLGQVPVDVQLAAVVILVEAGGGGDAHVQQILVLHLEHPLPDEVVGAGILHPRDAAGRHQLGDGGEYLVILGRRLFPLRAQHPGVGDRNGAACRVPDHAARQIHIGDEGLEHAARGQGGGIEADHIAVFVLCLRQCLGVVAAGMAVDPGQHHGVVRRRRIQGRQQGGMGGGGGVAVIGRPLVDHQPLPGSRGVAGQALADLGRELIQVDALAVQIAHVERHSAEQVDVVVVQPWQHHPPLQIHHLGRTVLQGLGPSAGAHVGELAPLHHHGLGLAALPILGVDLAVEIEGVAGGRFTAVLLAAEQAAHQQGDGAQPETGVFAIHSALSLG
ncbi:hypothetical protein D3C84_267590 [compost metagenome]